MEECKECGKEISSKAKKCPNCGVDTRNWFMRHKILSVIGVFVILGVFGAMISGGDDSEPQVATDSESNEESTEDDAEGVPEITISAVELAAAYEDNEVKANQDYKDKLAEIDGTVGSIGESMGTTYIVLSAEQDLALTEIQCFFNDEEEINKIADMSKGDNVSVIGEIDGMSMNVTVRNCVFN